MKCKHCGDNIRPDCDWRQGRCPHRPSFWDVFQQWWQRQFSVDTAEFRGKPNCHCYNCNKDYTEPGHVLPVTASRMTLCPTCGNKRCPHATDHREACTGSNDPGQPGSRY